MEMSASRIVAGDRHLVTSTVSTEVVRLIGNGCRDAAASEVPISSGWHEPQRSYTNTGLTLAVLLHCWDEQTFVPTSAATQLDPELPFGLQRRKAKRTCPQELVLLSVYPIIGQESRIASRS